jgi:hypothetical protein
MIRRKSKDITIEGLLKELEELKKRFDNHNHNDNTRPYNGNKFLDFEALKITLGNTQNNLPAINLVTISSDPIKLTNGDIWFDGTNLHIRINNTTYHINVTSA